MRRGAGLEIESYRERPPGLVIATLRANAATSPLASLELNFMLGSPRRGALVGLYGAGEAAIAPSL